MRPKRRVVVTGMGIVSSIGNNCTEVVQSLRDGRSGITFSPEQAELGFRSQVYGKPTLDWTRVGDRKPRRFMGMGSAWNYAAMEEAIQMSRLPPELVSNVRTGLIMGSGGPSVAAIVGAADTVRRDKSPKKIGPFEVPKAMSSTASATLAVPFHIKGHNFSVSSACATSAHCIGLAAQQICDGYQDVVFAGGSEELNEHLSAVFDAMPAMSAGFNDRPAVASRAFDKHRDGFVIAGGAAVLVLEAYEFAYIRKAPILAELVGFGLTSDGHDMVQPSGEGAVRCMNMALTSITTGERLHDLVGYINPHGTSTPVGDAKEIEAIRSVFGERIPPISSTKSLTGHSLGAVGAQEAVFSIMALREGFLPASAHIEELDPIFESVPILRQNVEARPEAVLSNSFGFGGTNASLVFKRWG
ncbi:MAG: beta-ketoacyl-ACP synthase I [Candidatus Pacebacteria bacterium]|nr:beta-ketoacyl-ACP synthase I [Candidatus Paceibacterota bacterium]